MSAPYQVLARKWRPQQFDELIGQAHVAQTLRNAIEQKRIAHAYLFCGPRGIGKTSTARIFAKALNCEKGPTVLPCDQCANCSEITAGNSMDVLEIDGASNRGIDEIRNLRENVRYVPAHGKFKIYIIDEVHMLTPEAFNALLKTLEEPPAHVKFIFATTEPEKMLPTILSRCQRFDLRRIPTRLIVDHLGKICKADKVKIEPAALSAIARGAEGGMRDAESTLDQLISFCGDKITEADVLSMFGLAAYQQIAMLAKGILFGDAAQTLATVGEISQAGKDLSRLLTDLLAYFHNLLVVQVRGDKADSDLPDDEMDSLRVTAKTVEPDGTLRVLEILAAAEGQIKWAASKRILLELTLLKAIQARQETSLEVVLKTLQEVRSQMGSSMGEGHASLPGPKPGAIQEKGVEKAKSSTGEVSPEQTPKTKSKSLSLESSPPAALVSPRQDSDAAGSALADTWRQVLEAVTRASPFTKSYLVEARPISFVGDVFVVGYDPEFSEHKNLVDTLKHKQILHTKLREVVGREVTVKFCLMEEAVLPAERGRLAGGSGRVKAETAKDFKEDPLIRAALEIFKGQIVDVKT